MSGSVLLHAHRPERLLERGDAFLHLHHGIVEERDHVGLLYRDRVDVRRRDAVLRADLAQRVVHDQELVRPEIERVDLGRLKVLAIFRTEAKSMIVGGRVLDGLIKPTALVEITREKEIISTGQLAGLQSGKIDTDQVEAGQECGVRFEGKPLIEEGDILVCYEEKKIVKKVG